MVRYPPADRYADAVAVSAASMYRHSEMQEEIAFYAVTEKIPGFLDVAGYGREAEEMRQINACAEETVAALRWVRDEAGGRWAPLLQEVCFWAEAMVWMAWAGDVEQFEECRRRVDEILNEGYALLTRH